MPRVRFFQIIRRTIKPCAPETSAPCIAVLDSRCGSRFANETQIVNRGCVELRALCNQAPRTPPGPEGSNGTGITLCAAEYPKFLSSFLFDLRRRGARKRKFNGLSSHRAQVA